MRAGDKVKKQTQRLVLITMVTVGMVALTIMAVYSQGWLGGKLYDTNKVSSSSTSASPTAAATTPAETTAAPTEIPTPTPIVIETDPAKLLLSIQDLLGYIPAAVNSNGSSTKTFRRTTVRSPGGFIRMIRT